MNLKQILLFSALLGVTVPAAFAGDCSQDDAQIYAYALGQYQSGLGDNLTVTKAKLYLLEAQYACGELTKADYCKDAVPTAQSLVTLVSQSMKVGQSTLNDLMDARKDQREVQAACK